MMPRHALRAIKFVQLGELSSGRQALECAQLAPGTSATLTQLRRRQDLPREPVPAHQGTFHFQSG